MCPDCPTLGEESGFTLIELLVVVAIIGILAAFASLQYPSYKARAFNARAMSDLKNIMSAQEASFADDETFISDISNLTGFDSASPSVAVILGVTGDSWAGSTYHPQGTETYCFDSAVGDIITIDGLAGTCP